MTDVTFLTSDEVADLAEPAEYVDAVRSAYRQRGEGSPARPRTKLKSAEPPGMMTTYVAMLPDTGVMGGYMYAAGFGAADAWFVTPLFDAESGQLEAVVDGAVMNPFKTGAAGAVGVDALAREDASVLGIIGTGSQARGQLLATATVREFDEVRAFSPTTENRESFAAEFDERLDADVTAVEDSAAAVEGSDVVITATNASEPVFDGERLDPGTHVTAMGQYDPTVREIDATTVARSKYVPDLEARATQDAGAYIQALDAAAIPDNHVYAELGEVVAGKVPGRDDPEDITVFDSGGNAIETVAAANLLYERAVEKERGTTISFSPSSDAFDSV